MHQINKITVAMPQLSLSVRFKPLLIVSQVLFLFQVLSACSNLSKTPLPSDHQSPYESDSVQSESQERRGSGNLNNLYANPAVSALVKKAIKDREAGRLSEALSTLERAQRISSSSSEVYYQLAKLRLVQNQFYLAVQLAKKGRSLLPSELEGSDLDRRLWKVQGDAYLQSGDSQRANEAFERAR